MLPHEKTLVKRLENEPFALIGINSDQPDLPKDATPQQRDEATRANLKKILSDNGITWRNAIDGDTSGPWATKWNVNGWPTIYVLDSKGVIRFRDVRDEEMEKAVLELLEEAKSGKAK